MGVGMARKRKTLPKDFENLLAAADLDALTAVYDTCELNARGGEDKTPAIGFANCPDALTQWLVARGLDVNDPGGWGYPPLWLRVRRGQDPTLLIELGADVNARTSSGRSVLHAAIRRPGLARQLLESGADPNITDSSGSTPLHDAVMGCAETVQILIDYGADTHAQDLRGRTPLEAGLHDCQNANIVETARSVKILLAMGVSAPANAPQLVERIGERFEWYRSGFDPTYLDETDAALNELYEMFGVAPVARRRFHDGVSTISVGFGQWRDQFSALQDYLVPAHGPASTIQGEVVRIAGNLSHEVLTNGGINWSANDRAQLNKLIAHLQSGTPVANRDELLRLRRSVPRGEAEGSTMDRLCQLAVAWVAANPEPVVSAEAEGQASI